MGAAKDVTKAGKRYSSHIANKSRIMPKPYQMHLYCKSRKKWRWMNCSCSLVIKNRIHIIAIVDQAPQCILGRIVVSERAQEVIQFTVDDAPKAKWCYARLWYHFDGYEVAAGKANTCLAE